MSQLTIYKASAGSGKTFRLTQEFLHLVYKYPENYRRILAVTFTNKATAEMKNRILNELNKLSKGLGSDYLEGLKNEFNISNSEIQAQAAKILSSVLHNYSKFSVSTIDRFFQKIIRAFTREVGIQPGFSIELSQDETLLKVIDELLLDLDENIPLKEWLSGLASSKIEQGKKWDFKEDIQTLAKEIFKEEFKAFDKKLIKKLSDKDFLKNYTDNLLKIKERFENFLTSKSKEALSLIQRIGLTIDDFSRKSGGPAGYFYKIIDKSEFEPGKLFIGALDDTSKWYTKTSDKKDDIETALNEGLLDISKTVFKYFEKEKILYYSSIEVLKYIHTLGILTDLSEKLREYTDEQNIFLISDAAQLIQIIVDNNESPFIYEKTGNIYKHFMLDEFQDTSKIQWHNFKPLIGNSLAQGSKNLVVGDVKQSIYRWRNSDWEILSSQILNEFAQFNPKAKSLSTNWRSNKNIIEYNNAVFSFSAKILQQQFNDEFLTNRENSFASKITDAYQDVFQNTSGNKKDGGFINHTFLDEQNYDSWKDEVKQRLPRLIEELQDKGYHLNDIAILVRTAREGQEIAKTLIEYKNQNNSTFKFDFISNDSLFLQNSSLVRFILAILEFILNPEDEINLSFIAYEFKCYLLNENISNEELHRILKNKKDAADCYSEIFPKEFVDSMDQIKQLPIYELTDRIVRVFKLYEIKTELPFLKAFLDIILDFSKKSASDIHAFLNWWNDEGNNKTLVVSENQDAIRILTIHSSKGLEFKNVIIPFCNWDIGHKPTQTNILWCSTAEEPFNQLDLIPVRYSKNLEKTIFNFDYLREKFHAYVDNLNLLYVAFTRAKNNLFCFSPIKEKKNGISRVNELLYFTYQNSNNYQNENNLLKFDSYWNTETKTLEIGNLRNNISKVKGLPDELVLEKFESFDIKNKLRLKLHDNSFFTGHESEPFEKVNYGKLMHEVFENIKYENDILHAIDKLTFEGKISPNDKPELQKKIENVFENSQVKNWFSNQWDVKTEAEIILPNGKTARPDRVISNANKTIIIDYKFGEQEEEKHIKQVQSYIDILKKMEEKDTEGYLWYVDLGHIRQVK